MLTLAEEKAKRYALINYTLTIVEVVYLLALLFLFIGLGFSRLLAENLSRYLLKYYFVIPTYIFIAYAAYYILNFPLNFYQSFILEHKFSLSKQKIKDWLADQIKSGIISYMIILILIAVFYYVLRHFSKTWWFIMSLFWIFFHLILAKVTPIIIVPLFFKYKQLSDEELRQRIIKLAQKVQVKILDVFEIDFSKKTLKANAAFLGWGASRRVILADTLKDKYSHDEIEVILAHEFAHYKLNHLLKLVLIDSAATLILFYLIFKTSFFTLSIFGFSSLLDISTLPIIMVYFVLFGIIMQPLLNYISRIFERNADRMALGVTGLKGAFISMMNKLAEQNLADRRPNPLIKFFFFDHPPVDERIRLASSYK